MLFSPKICSRSFIKQSNRLHSFSASWSDYYELIMRPIIDWRPILTGPILTVQKESNSPFIQILAKTRINRERLERRICCGCYNRIMCYCSSCFSSFCFNCEWLIRSFGIKSEEGDYGVFVQLSTSIIFRWWTVIYLVKILAHPSLIFLLFKWKSTRS